MPICTGCSKNFPHMQGNRCQICASRPCTDPTQCVDCGLVYDFLGGDTCQSCANKKHLAEGLGTAVQQAIANAPNPRHPNPQLVPQFTYRGPPTEQEINKADEVRGFMKSAYTHTLQKAGGNPTLLQGPKIGSKPVSVPTNKLDYQIWVIVKKITIKWASGSSKSHPKPDGPQPFGKLYPLASSWSDIIYEVRAHVDAKLQKNVLGMKLMDSDDIEFCFEASSTVVSDVFLNGALDELWKYATAKNHVGQLLTAGNFTQRRLILTAQVTLNQEAVTTAVTTTFRTSSKRLRSDSTGDFQRSVRQNTPGGMNTIKLRDYKTTINRSTQFRVREVVCTLANDNQTTMVPYDTTFLVQVDNVESASGKTKTMHRLVRDNGSTYAAKAFYCLGNQSQTSTPSFEENLAALQQEVVVTTIAKSICDDFNLHAEAMGVGISAIRVSRCSIFEVVEGPKTGHAWLVDTLLPTTTVQKFSGTNVAGSNNRLLGQTCDAFAHYSLTSSGGKLVLVDIQGILVHENNTGLNSPPTFVLFDLMTHTIDGESGIGDGGTAAIDTFKRQHQCNTICEKLGLQACDTFDDAGLEENSNNSDTAEELDDGLSNHTTVPKACDMVPMTVKQARIGTEFDDDGNPCVSVYDPGSEYQVDILVSSTPFAKLLGPYEFYKMQIPRGSIIGGTDFIAWTIPHVNWAGLRIDTSLDAYLHRTLIRHGELRELSKKFFDTADAYHIQVSNFRFAPMFLTLAVNHEAQFLCTAPINLAQVVTQTGITLTSESLVAQTVHAFSHFASKAEDFTIVIMDISYVLEENTAVILDHVQHTQTTDPMDFYRDHGCTQIDYYRNHHCCNAICSALAL